MKCSNNLKQIGLGIMNYEGVYGKFPPATTRVEIDTWMHGPTWWVYTMPYMELDSAYKQIVFPRQTFWFGGTTHPNTQIWKNIGFSFMQCPSSPLPQLSTSGNDSGYQRPFYTCVLGAVPHSSGMTANSQFRGPISDGGVLTLARGQLITSVTDGTSNTIMVAEQSGQMYHRNGQALPIAGDTANNDGRVDNNRGFHMGTSHVGFPRGNNSMGPASGGGTCSTSNNCARCYNTTTINTLGINAGTRQPGLLFADYGELRCNKPLTSPHSGGILAVFADGHVQFLRETMTLATLKALANRDDGAVIDIP
jgi:prepilin-type processing-associated H-X9-DG protein